MTIVEALGGRFWFSLGAILFLISLLEISAALYSIARELKKIGADYDE